MPPVIEFNEKAKPQLAPAFGGSLELGHYYMLKSGCIMQTIKNEGEGPPTWVKGQYLSGVEEGCHGWWFKNGLYQGKEFSATSIHHVLKEVEKPAVNTEPKELVLHIGGVYKSKGGNKTQPMALHSAFDGQINGPVFKTFLVDENDATVTSKCYYNQKGGYLGLYSDQLKVIPASARNLVSELESEKILTAAQAKQLWMNSCVLKYRHGSTSGWLPFPPKGATMYTEYWFDTLPPFEYKVA